MNPLLQIEQAVFEAAPELVLRGRSPGFLDDWLSDARRLCRGFGERPADSAPFTAVFAQPFGSRHAAVVQVQTGDRPNVTLMYRLLILRRDLYAALGDPFLIADQLAPPWNPPSELPILHWPDEPPPPRTVAALQRLLKENDGPTLLGAVQGLIDGSPLVFERAHPDPTTIRAIWTLLPHAQRATLWPATFALANTLRFDLLVLPRVEGDVVAGYLTEEQAVHYPQGRYELNLQIAVEDGNQHALDALFQRRSTAQSFRLMAAILIGLLLLLGVMKWINVFPRVQ